MHLGSSGFECGWTWWEYITIATLHKDEIDDFHEHLNRQNAHIQFTKEIKVKGKIPFLDCLVIHDNNRLHTTVYRKPTHTDRLLDESSCNPTSHKATTIRTLTRRALLVCDSHDSLADKHKHSDNVFSKNNYNCDFVTRNTYRTEPNATNTNLTPTTTVTIPYIRRIVLESWFTNLEQTPINRCPLLPAPYKRLIDDINRQTTHWFTLNCPTYSTMHVQTLDL